MFEDSIILQPQEVESWSESLSIEYSKDIEHTFQEIQKILSKDDNKTERIKAILQKDNKNTEIITRDVMQILDGENADFVLWDAKNGNK